MDIDGSIAAVVTGAASGLGAATARALAAKGAKVAVLDLQEDKGEALAAAIGGVFCKVDVTSDGSVDAGFAKARAAHGQERVLVNCAGVGNASVAAEDGQVGQAAYSASKGGVVGMTLPIARDLMGEGIRVNTILPGIFETPLMMGAPQTVRDVLAASVPFPKRFGQPEGYAKVALTKIERGYLNGEDVRPDGGIRMPPR